jgi:hypothetical protein
VAETLRTRLISRDAARFVGRVEELARLDALLVDDPPVSVVLIHGPAGVGKSALLPRLPSDALVVVASQQAAFELGLSRAAYFRRLRKAVERVAEQLGAVR